MHALIKPGCNRKSVGKCGKANFYAKCGKANFYAKCGKANFYARCIEIKR